MKINFLKKWVSTVLICTQLGSLTFSDARASEKSQGISGAPAISAGSLRIAPELGRVQTRVAGKLPKTLLVIEDAHSVPAAQKSIWKLIENLHGQYGSFPLLLEGVTEAPDLALEHSFPDRNWLLSQMESDVQSQNISGAAAALILSQQLTSRSAESKDLYLQAVRLYQEAQRQQTAVLEKLARARDVVAKAKEKIYPREALKWNRLIEQDSLDGLKIVLESGQNESFKNYKHLQSTRELVRRQQFLKRPAVVRFWGQFLAKLEQRAELVSQKKFLATLKEEFRLNSSTLPDSAEKLEALLSAAEVSTMTKLEQRLYGLALKSAREWREINAAELAEEYRAFLIRKTESFFTKSAQRILLKQTLRIQLLEKLVRLELSHADWKIAQKMSLENPAWTVFKDFYAIQHDRERMMAKQIEKSFQKASSAVFVSGGFHRAGLEQIARDQGWGVVVITPAMKTLEGAERYADLMRGQVSWRSEMKNERGNIDLQKAYWNYLIKQYAKEKPEQVYGLLLQWRKQLVLRLADLKQLNHAVEVAVPIHAWLVEFMPELSKQKFRTEWLNRLEKKNLTAGANTLSPAMTQSPFLLPFGTVPADLIVENKVVSRKSDALNQAVRAVAKESYYPARAEQITQAWNFLRSSILFDAPGEISLENWVRINLVQLPRDYRIIFVGLQKALLGTGLATTVFLAELLLKTYKLTPQLVVSSLLAGVLGGLVHWMNQALRSTRMLHDFFMAHQVQIENTAREIQSRNQGLPSESSILKSEAKTARSEMRAQSEYKDYMGFDQSQWLNLFREKGSISGVAAFLGISLNNVRYYLGKNGLRAFEKYTRSFEDYLDRQTLAKFFIKAGGDAERTVELIQEQLYETEKPKLKLDLVEQKINDYQFAEDQGIQDDLKMRQLLIEKLIQHGGNIKRTALFLYENDPERAPGVNISKTRWRPHALESMGNRYGIWEDHEFISRIESALVETAEVSLALIDPSFPADSASDVSPELNILLNSKVAPDVPQWFFNYLGRGKMNWFPIEIALRGGLVVPSMLPMSFDAAGKEGSPRFVFQGFQVSLTQIDWEQTPVPDLLVREEMEEDWKQIGLRKKRIEAKSASAAALQAEALMRALSLSRPLIRTRTRMITRDHIIAKLSERRQNGLLNEPMVLQNSKSHLESESSLYNAVIKWNQKHPENWIVLPSSMKSIDRAIEGSLNSRNNNYEGVHRDKFRGLRILLEETVKQNKPLAEQPTLVEFAEAIVKQIPSSIKKELGMKAAQQSWSHQILAMMEASVHELSQAEEGWLLEHVFFKKMHAEFAPQFKKLKASSVGVSLNQTLDDSNSELGEIVADQRMVNSEINWNGLVDQFYQSLRRKKIKHVSLARKREIAVALQASIEKLSLTIPALIYLNGSWSAMGFLSSEDSPLDLIAFTALPGEALKRGLESTLNRDFPGLKVKVINVTQESKEEQYFDWILFHEEESLIFVGESQPQSERKVRAAFNRNANWINQDLIQSAIESIMEEVSRQILNTPAGRSESRVALSLSDNHIAHAEKVNLDLNQKALIEEYLPGAFPADHEGFRLIEQENRLRYQADSQWRDIEGGDVIAFRPKRGAAKVFQQETGISLRGFYVFQVKEDLIRYWGLKNDPNSKIKGKAQPSLGWWLRSELSQSGVHDISNYRQAFDIDMSILERNRKAAPKSRRDRIILSPDYFDFFVVREANRSEARQSLLNHPEIGKMIRSELVGQSAYFMDVYQARLKRPEHSQVGSKEWLYDDEKVALAVNAYSKEILKGHYSPLTRFEIKQFRKANWSNPKKDDSKEEYYSKEEVPFYLERRTHYGLLNDPKSLKAQNPGLYQAVLREGYEWKNKTWARSESRVSVDSIQVEVRPLENGKSVSDVLSRSRGFADLMESAYGRGNGSVFELKRINLNDPNAVVVAAVDSRNKLVGYFVASPFESVRSKNFLNPGLSLDDLGEVPEQKAYYVHSTVIHPDYHHSSLLWKMWNVFRAELNRRQVSHVLMHVEKDGRVEKAWLARGAVVVESNQLSSKMRLLMMPVNRHVRSEMRGEEQSWSRYGQALEGRVKTAIYFLKNSQVYEHWKSRIGLFVKHYSRVGDELKRQVAGREMVEAFQKAHALTLKNMESSGRAQVDNQISVTFAFYIGKTAVEVLSAARVDPDGEEYHHGALFEQLAIDLDKTDLLMPMIIGTFKGGAPQSTEGLLDLLLMDDHFTDRRIELLGLLLSEGGVPLSKPVKLMIGNQVKADIKTLKDLVPARSESRIWQFADLGLSQTPGKMDLVVLSETLNRFHASPDDLVLIPKNVELMIPDRLFLGEGNERDFHFVPVAQGKGEKLRAKQEGIRISFSGGQFSLATNGSKPQFEMDVSSEPIYLKGYGPNEIALEEENDGEKLLRFGYVSHRRANYLRVSSEGNGEGVTLRVSELRGVNRAIYQRSEARETEPVNQDSDKQILKNRFYSQITMGAVIWAGLEITSWYFGFPFLFSLYSWINTFYWGDFAIGGLITSGLIASLTGAIADYYTQLISDYPAYRYHVKKRFAAFMGVRFLTGVVAFSANIYWVDLFTSPLLRAAISGFVGVSFSSLISVYFNGYWNRRGVAEMESRGEAKPEKIEELRAAYSTRSQWGKDLKGVWGRLPVLLTQHHLAQDVVPEYLRIPTIFTLGLFMQLFRNYMVNSQKPTFDLKTYLRVNLSVVGLIFILGGASALSIVFAGIALIGVTAGYFAVAAQTKEVFNKPSQAPIPESAVEIKSRLFSAEESQSFFKKLLNELSRRGLSMNREGLDISIDHEDVLHTNARGFIWDHGADESGKRKYNRFYRWNRRDNMGGIILYGDQDVPILGYVVFNRLEEKSFQLRFQVFEPEGKLPGYRGQGHGRRLVDFLKIYFTRYFDPKPENLFFYLSAEEARQSSVFAIPLQRLGFELTNNPKSLVLKLNRSEMRQVGGVASLGEIPQFTDLGLPQKMVWNAPHSVNKKYVLETTETPWVFNVAVHQAGQSEVVGEWRVNVNAPSRDQAIEFVSRLGLDAEDQRYLETEIKADFLAALGAVGFRVPTLALSIPPEFARFLGYAKAIGIQEGVISQIADFSVMGRSVDEAIEEVIRGAVSLKDKIQLIYLSRVNHPTAKRSAHLSQLIKSDWTKFRREQFGYGATHIYRVSPGGVAYDLWIPEKKQGKKTPVVVFFHGMTDSKELPYFDALEKRAFEEGAAVMRVDLPGHGETLMKLGDDYVFNDFLTEVLKIIQTKDQLNGDEIYVAGHSLGGLVALRALLHRDFAKHIKKAAVWAPAVGDVFANAAFFNQRFYGQLSRMFQGDDRFLTLSEVFEISKLALTDDEIRRIHDDFSGRVRVWAGREDHLVLPDIRRFEKYASEQTVNWADGQGHYLTSEAKFQADQDLHDFFDLQFRSETRKKIESEELNHWISEINRLMNIEKAQSFALSALTRQIRDRLDDVEKQLFEGQVMTFEHRWNSDRSGISDWEQTQFKAFLAFAFTVLAAEKPDLKVLRQADQVIAGFNQKYSDRQWGLSLTLMMQLATNDAVMDEKLKKQMYLAGKGIQLPGEYKYRMAAMTLYLLGMHVKSLIFEGPFEEEQVDFFPRRSLPLAIQTIQSGIFNEDVPEELQAELMLNLKAGLMMYLFGGMRFWRYASLEDVERAVGAREHFSFALAGMQERSFDAMRPLQDWIVANRDDLVRVAEEMRLLAEKRNVHFLVPGTPWLFDEVVTPLSMKKSFSLSWDLVLLNPFSVASRKWFLRFFFRYSGLENLSRHDVEKIIKQHRQRYAFDKIARADFDALIHNFKNFQSTRPEMREIIIGTADFIESSREYSGFYESREEVLDELKSFGVDGVLTSENWNMNGVERHFEHTREVITLKFSKEDALFVLAYLEALKKGEGVKEQFLRDHILAIAGNNPKPPVPVEVNTDFAAIYQVLKNSGQEFDLKLLYQTFLAVQKEDFKGKYVQDSEGKINFGINFGLWTEDVFFEPYTERIDSNFIPLWSSNNKEDPILEEFKYKYKIPNPFIERFRELWDRPGQHNWQLAGSDKLVVPEAYRPFAIFYLKAGKDRMTKIVKQKASLPLVLDSPSLKFYLAERGVPSPQVDERFIKILSHALKINPGLNVVDFYGLYLISKSKDLEEWYGFSNFYAERPPESEVLASGQKIKRFIIEKIEERIDNYGSDYKNLEKKIGSRDNPKNSPYLSFLRDKLKIEHAYTEHHTYNCGSSCHWEIEYFERYLVVPDEHADFVEFYLKAGEFSVRSLLFSESENIQNEVLLGVRRLGQSSSGPGMGSKETGFLAFEHLGLPYPPGIVLSEQLVLKILTLSPLAVKPFMNEIEGILRKELGVSHPSLVVSISVRSNPKKSMPGILETYTDTWEHLPAIRSVAQAWYSEKAQAYREREGIPHDYDLPVILQQWVSGQVLTPWRSIYHSQGVDSQYPEKRKKDPALPFYGSGVFSTRNPNTGENKIYGRYLENANGEDLMTGGKAGNDIFELETSAPDVYAQLIDAAKKLEDYQGPREVEFVVNEGKVYFLQNRRINFSPQAEIDYLKGEIAAGRITEARVIPQMEALQKKIRGRSIFRVKENAGSTALGYGLASTAGAIRGRLVWNIEKAEEYISQKQPIIFAMPQYTNRNKILEMIFEYPRTGLITFDGNSSSHEAVLTRLAGIPSLINLQNAKLIKEGIQFDEAILLIEGDWVVVDGDQNRLLIAEDEALETNGSILDASYGVDIVKMREDYLSPFINEGGSIKPEFDVVALQKLNEVAAKNFKSAQEGDDRKAEFVANLEKHFIHDLLIQRQSEEGVGRSEARNLPPTPSDVSGGSIRGEDEARFRIWLKAQMAADTVEMVNVAQQTAEVSPQIRAFWKEGLVRWQGAISSGDIQKTAPVIFHSHEIESQLIEFIELTQKSFESVYAGEGLKRYRFSIVFLDEREKKAFVAKHGKMTGVKHYTLANMDFLKTDVFNSAEWKQHYGVFGFDGELQAAAWQRNLATALLPSELSFALIPDAMAFFSVTQTDQIELTLASGLTRWIQHLQIRKSQGIFVLSTILEFFSVATRRVMISA